MIVDLVARGHEPGSFLVDVHRGVLHIVAFFTPKYAAPCAPRKSIAFLRIHVVLTAWISCWGAWFAEFLCLVRCVALELISGIVFAPLTVVTEANALFMVTDAMIVDLVARGHEPGSFLVDVYR